MLLLKILGGIAALALGVWLGLPGRYDQRHDEIERAIDTPGGRTKKVKRHFTPLAWVRRQVDVTTGSSRARSKEGRGFRMARPDRDGEAAGQSGGGAFKLERPGQGSGRGSKGGSASKASEASENTDEERRRFKLRHPEDRTSR